MKVLAQGGPSQNSRTEMKPRRNHEKCSPVNNDTSRQNCCFVENLFFYLYDISWCTCLLSYVTAQPPPRFSDLHNGRNLRAHSTQQLRGILEKLKYCTRYAILCLCKTLSSFYFGSLPSVGRVFLLALSAAGQAGLPLVHYEACRDLRQAPWRRLAH